VPAPLLLYIVMFCVFNRGFARAAKGLSGQIGPPVRVDGGPGERQTEVGNKRGRGAVGRRHTRAWWA